MKFTNAIARILDIFFPRTCVGCGKHGVLFCESCLAKTPRATSSTRPFIHSVFDYRHPAIKKAVWRLKYSHARGIADIFAEHLYEEIVGALGDSLSISRNENILLVPIPLHASRLRERGYNQSEIIARAVMKCDTNKIFSIAPHVLKRTRATKPQARSDNRANRLANMRGAFTVTDPSRVHGCTIVLIDDVTTTGATLLEAHRALKTAKPREVLAFTIAH